jgi:glycosyltransferase involved in cell wall biosynthesis
MNLVNITSPISGTNTYGFASYEIYPTLKGGVGSLLMDFLKGLKDTTCRIVLLLDITPAQTRQFRDVDLPNQGVIVDIIPICVEELVGTLADRRATFSSEYEFRSFRFAQALKEAHKLYDIFYFEFFDYCGVSFFSLAERLVYPELYPKIISIHHHNTIEIIDHSTYGRLIDERWDAYVLERTAMPMADCYIVHGRLFFQNEYEGRYLLDPTRAILMAPRCHKIADAPASSSCRNRVLFYGRQSRLKGLDIFLAGAVLFLASNAQADVLFTIIGPPDTVTDTLISIDDVVPSERRKHFEVIGQIDRNDLAIYANEAVCGVFANRTESFCFALHELFQLGLPIIANDIPAFRDHLSDDEVLFFDGTVQGLSSSLALLLSDNELLQRLRQRTDAQMLRYQGGDWAEVILKLPATPRRCKIEKVLILSLTSSRIEAQPQKPWVLTTTLSDTVSVLDVTLQRDGSGKQLFLFGVNWTIPAWLVESGAVIQSYDLIIFAKDRSQLDQVAINRLIDIATYNNRNNAALVVTPEGDKKSFSSQAIEALMPRCVVNKTSPVDVYALWNWPHFTIRDFEGVLHHAEWTHLIPAIASNKAPWIAHIPGNVLGMRTLTSSRTKIVHSSKDFAICQSLLYFNKFGDSSQEFAEAILATESDNTLFYIFNGGIHSAKNEVWLAGKMLNNNTLNFENNNYQIFGKTTETQIHITNKAIPVVQLLSGYLKGHRTDSALCAMLRHPYSGSVIVVVEGKVILESLNSIETCLSRLIIDFKGVPSAAWRSLSFPHQRLSALGPKTIESRNSVELFDAARNQSICHQNLTSEQILELVRDPTLCQQILELVVGPEDLVSLIDASPSVCKHLSLRIVLKHCDFWSSASGELVALARLAGPLYAPHLNGNIATNSQSVKNYFYELGIDLSVREEQTTNTYVRSYRPGMSILVIAFPNTIASVSHVMAGISMSFAEAAPASVFLTAGSEGQIVLDPSLFPNISIDLLEARHCCPAKLPGIGAVICLYPHSISSSLLRDWITTGVPIIVSRATADAIFASNIREIVLWDDSFALAEIIGDCLKQSADEVNGNFEAEK